MRSSEKLGKPTGKDEVETVEDLLDLDNKHSQAVMAYVMVDFYNRGLYPFDMNRDMFVEPTELLFELAREHPITAVEYCAGLNALVGSGFTFCSGEVISPPEVVH